MIFNNPSKTMIASFFLIMFSTNISLASGFGTPKDTMETMLDAARKADAHLWSTCLSEEDRKIYNLTFNKKAEEELLARKSWTEKQCGIQLGNNAYEYGMFAAVHETTHGRKKPGDPATNRLYDMAYIKQELIWDDRYAEVILIMPVEGKGLVPPMTFYFFKENGKWVLCQWMSTRLLLGWSASENFDYNDRVSFQIIAHTDYNFDRRNCSRMTKREFPISDKLSGIYRQAIEADPLNEELLALWFATGDSKAKEYADSTKRQIKDMYSYWLKKWTPCDPITSADTRQQKRMHYNTAEGWYYAADIDIIAQQGLLKRFPKDRQWCAKAQLVIASRIAYEGNTELAMKEYSLVISEYPEQEKEVTEAKNELVKLIEKYLQPNPKTLSH